MAEQLAQGDERPELRHGRGLRTVLIAGLVGALVGAGVAWHSSLDPDPYTSTTTVAVKTPQSAAETASVNMDNELQVITSDKVGDAAKALLRVDTETNVLERQLTATVPANTSVIDVSFSASTPEEAIAGSHAFAVAYLNFRTDQAKGQTALLTEQLMAQQTRLQAFLAKLTAAYAATAAGTAKRAYAQAQVTIVEQEIVSTGGQLASLSRADPTAGEIIQDASLPTAPDGPNPNGFWVLGLAIGLLAGLVITRLPRNPNGARSPTPSPA